jgi:ribosomal protein S18 acetylase RimI-like enzyme
MVRVRAMSGDDLDAAVALHLEVLHMEFLSRFGPGFMRIYYGAWIDAPGSIGLAAVDDHGVLLGVLLGASDPANHVRAMVRHRGLALGAKLLAHSLTHPRLAKDLVVTRGWRYTRGVARLVKSRVTRRPTSGPAASGPVVGEITHVLVSPSAQGQGVGRALVEESVRVARAAGVQELELVTPPDMAAQHFYERLGWRASGAMQSRSGESFLRYRFTV